MGTLTRTMRCYEQGADQGLHVGMQLAASVSGDLVADVAIGRANEASALTHDTLMIWLSTTKLLTAVAMAQLWERGCFGLDDPVAAHLPEFGDNGKRSVTIRHVLTHTGGFRNADGMLLAWDAEVTSAELYARICAAPLEEGWRPGLVAGYHGSAGHVVLGELIAQLTGRPVEVVVRENVLEPAGAEDWWLGVPHDRQLDYDGRLASMWWCQGPERGPAPTFDTVACRERTHAGMSGRGPARELVKVLEALRVDATGSRPPILVRAQTWEAFTARHRVGVLDRTFQQVLDWGLGVIPAMPGENGPVPYGYGQHCSPRTWGHSGAQSSTAFVDPAKGLVVALAFNGMPGHLPHTQRQHDLVSALYDDLGLI